MKNKHSAKREATQEELDFALGWAEKNYANNLVANLFFNLLGAIGSVEEASNNDAENGIYNAITHGTRFNDSLHEIADEVILAYQDIFTLRDDLAILICRFQKYKNRLP